MGGVSICAVAAAVRGSIVENVDEPSVAEPLSGLLSRLEGYDVSTATLDPVSLVKAPIARARRYWVLELAG
jgi:hypothetical protein